MERNDENNVLYLAVKSQELLPCYKNVYPNNDVETEKRELKKDLQTNKNLL